MGDDDHRHAVTGELLHDLEHLVDHLGVEGRRRLVEEHDLRIHRQCARDRDALLLAAGELRRVLVRLVGDPHPVEQASAPVRLGLLAFLRTLIWPSITFCSTVLCANRLKDWKTIPTSARSRASSLALGGQRLAVDGDLAGVDGLQPVDGAAQRRLPGAGRPDDDHDLAPGDRQVDVLEHVQRAEVLLTLLSAMRASLLACVALPLVTVAPLIGFGVRSYLLPSYAVRLW